jgi:hypothetical protein
MKDTTIPLFQWSAKERKSLSLQDFNERKRQLVSIDSDSMKLWTWNEMDATIEQAYSKTSFEITPISSPDKTSNIASSVVTSQ